MRLVDRKGAHWHQSCGEPDVDISEWPSTDSDSELKHGIFRVKRYPDGKYENIEAESKKDAAEKFYGRNLSEVGSTHQLRVMLRAVASREQSAALFYDQAW